MFCHQCGSQLPDNSAFCGFCGKELKSVAVQFDNIPQPETWESYFLKKWKGFVCSPLVLALLVSVTASLVLTATWDPLDMVYDVLRAFDIPYWEVQQAMGDLSIVVNSVKIASMVPGILVAVSLWLVFADAMKGGPRLNTTGMTIIQVLQIMGLVGVCLSFGLPFLGMLIAIGEVSNGYYADETLTALGMALVVILLVGTFCIFVYARILSLIKSAKTTITTFVPTCNGAMFVGVLSIIGGSISALSIAGTFSNGIDWTMLLATASNLLYGIVAISYKSFVEDLSADRAMMIQN